MFYFLNKKCPKCGHNNEPNATRCVQCGTPLTGVTTIASASELAQIEVLRPLVQPLALTIGEIVFLVAGHSDPIRMPIPTEQKALVIGRRAEGSPAPDLDLTGSGEAAGSVSRHHAALRFDGEFPTVTDLDSTNGTWLNENRLPPGQPHPVRTGDLIRLGQQFVFVYFPLGADAASAVVLTDPNPSAKTLTPRLLVHTIGGYLQALADVQAVLNQAQGRPAADVTIADLNLSRAPAVTKLHLTGASEAVKLVTEALTPWRKQREQQLSQLWQSNPPDESLQTPLADDLARLLKSKLAELAPSLADADQNTHAQQLLPPARVIALGKLWLSTDSKG